VSIEFLYIIPIIALVIFAFSISYVAQKRAAAAGRGQCLDVEVRQFNNGNFIAQTQAAESRLDEFEDKIIALNKALSNQQKVIEKFQEENSTYNEEIDRLKKNLRELHKEHDIVVSENYSLRAKYNNLVKNFAPEAQIAPDIRSIESIPEPKPELTSVAPKRTSSPTIAWERGSANILDETKPYSANVLEDTSIIDLSDVFK
jgi:regulator of replication initiation timing